MADADIVLDGSRVHVLGDRVDVDNELRTEGGINAGRLEVHARGSFQDVFVVDETGQLTAQSARVRGSSAAHHVTATSAVTGGRVESQTSVGANLQVDVGYRSLARLSLDRDGQVIVDTGGDPQPLDSATRGRLWVSDERLKRLRDGTEGAFDAFLDPAGALSHANVNIPLSCQGADQEGDHSPAGELIHPDVDLPGYSVDVEDDVVERLLAAIDNPQKLSQLLIELSQEPRLQRDSAGLHPDRDAVQEQLYNEELARIKFTSSSATALADCLRLALSTVVDSREADALALKRRVLHLAVASFRRGLVINRSRHYPTVTVNGNTVIRGDLVVTGHIFCENAPQTAGVAAVLDVLARVFRRRIRNAINQLREVDVRELEREIERANRLEELAHRGRLDETRMGSYMGDESGTPPSGDGVEAVITPNGWGVLRRAVLDRLYGGPVTAGQAAMTELVRRWRQDGRGRDA